MYKDCVVVIFGQRQRVRVSGFFAIDCHGLGGDCGEDVAAMHNAEIHPVYAIDLFQDFNNNRSAIANLSGVWHCATDVSTYFVAGDFGVAASSMDYPDLGFSSTFLYVSTDVFTAGGRLVVRIPLKDLAAGGTIGFEYTDPAQSTNAWGGHLVQATWSSAVWAGHQDNSKLEIFTMPDGGNTYSSFTVPVSAWPNGTHSSLGPDGNDWLAKLANFPNFAVTGGAERGDGQVVLAWSASSGKGTSNGFNFPNTHARIVEVDLAARSVVSELPDLEPRLCICLPLPGDQCP